MYKISSLLLLLGFAIAGSTSGQERTPYVWAATGKLITARSNACAVPLADGRVLVAGGDGSDGALASVEWYGNDALFHAAAPMARARSRAACAALPDGRVLVAGGRTSGDGPGAEIYDPTADQWQAAASEPLSRWGQTASVLSDGRVLLAGGENDAGASSALEVFYPSTNSFELLTSTLTTTRTLHAAAVLEDNHVLIVGGTDGRLFLNTADLVDPDTGAVEPLPDLQVARAEHSLTTLLDGTVLVAGGRNGDGDLSSSLLYLPGEKRFLAGPALNTARSGHQALRIPNNGNVLLIGGSSGGTATGSTEAFDFLLGSFVPVGSLTLARVGLAAAAQGDQGVVLAVGGATGEGPVAACGTLSSPTLTPTKHIYLEGESAVLNGAHYAAGEVVTFSIQRTAVNGAVSSISIPSLVTTSSGTFQTAVPGQSAGFRVIVGATGNHSGLSASATYTVGAATTTTLTITPAGGSISAQAVTLSVQVHPASIAGPLLGTVSFFDGSTLLGSVASGKSGGLIVDTDQNGTGTLSFSFGGGTHSLQAVFDSKSFYTNSATLAVSYPVTKRDPLTAITSSPATVRLGGSIVLQANVSAAGGVPLVRPTGAIQWAEVTAQGITLLGVTQLTGAAGFAGLTTVTASFTLPAGNTALTRSFRVVYSGDDNYSKRIDFLNVTVLRSLPALSPVSEVIGSDLDTILPNIQYFTAVPNVWATVITFTRVNGSSPTGRIFLRSGNLTVATQNVPAGISSATVIFQFAFTISGALSLQAEYEGDTNFEPLSTAVLPLTVAKAAPHMLITYPAVVGLREPNVPVTVEMDQEAGPAETTTAFTPTGTMQIFRNSETTALLTVTLAAGTDGFGEPLNVAHFVFPRPPSAGETFRLVYSGDAIFAPETATTGLITGATDASTPTMFLNYRPDVQIDSVIHVQVRLAVLQADGSVTFRDSTGVIQAFVNDATTATDTLTLSAGKLFFVLGPPGFTSPPTITYRFVYIGPDPTVQGVTGAIHIS